MSRVIRIYNTQTTNRNSIESSAATWSELQRDLSAQNVGWSGLKAVIGETELTLESPTAVLPEGEFTLFLMPSKVKSGYDDDMDSDSIENDWDGPSNEPQPINTNAFKPQAGIVGELRSVAATLNDLANRLDAIDFTLSPEEMELSEKGREIAKKLAGAFS